MTASTLGDLLDPLTIEGELYEPLPDGALRCYACGHRCLIKPGRRGICKVRFNQEGVLRVPWGYVGAFQAMRDPASDVSALGLRPITPQDMVDYGLSMGARVVGSSYNEPLITSEWAVSVFRPAREAGLTCAYISNGNATQEVLEYIRPFVTAYKIDLKSMRDPQYRSLGGVLQNVLDGIRMVHEMGFWLEVVTLIVPGFNDSNEELMDAARFLCSVSPDIPWHVTAFQ